MQENEERMKQGTFSVYSLTGYLDLFKIGKRPRKGKHEDLPKPTELMKQREDDLELDKNLNKTMIVHNPTGRGPGQPGFHCETCNRTYRDTTAYLDHINGRQRESCIMHYVRRTFVKTSDQIFDASVKRRESHVQLSSKFEPGLHYYAKRQRKLPMRSLTTLTNASQRLKRKKMQHGLRRKLKRRRNDRRHFLNSLRMLLLPNKTLLPTSL